MAIKTDMSKAYDRVEWSFLESIMKVLGFCDKWRTWIMGCVSTVSYATLINGQPFGEIIPTRGIRQGDPLSPLLFVLCTEALVHLLTKAENEKLLTGFKCDKEGPMISHLLFADDSLFICKANKHETTELVRILKLYESISGQLINFEKSAITFGKLVPDLDREWIKNHSGILKEGGDEKYLGLPECFSGSKQNLLAYIRERLNSRIQSWHAKTLSQGGKEVLIKSVALAMPVYAMSCFKLPVKLCKSLTSAITDFWWDNDSSKHKMHWISKEKLSLPKNAGGLGFKDLCIFNQALLAKQAWRLIANPESLFTRFFRSRYFKGHDFMMAGHGSLPSYGWRSIMWGKECIKLGLQRTIGSGLSTKVWKVPWLFDKTPIVPLSIQGNTNPEMVVAELFNSDTGEWDRSKLQHYFTSKDIDLILQVKPGRFQDDGYIWKDTRSGTYSVRTGYERLYHAKTSELITTATTLPSMNSIYDSIWKHKTSSKLKVFLWKIMKGALPVDENFMKRGMDKAEGCQLCDEAMDSSNHILFTCTFARQVWALANIPNPKEGFCNSQFENLHYVLSLSKHQNLGQDSSLMIPWILWRIWKNRNSMAFTGKFYSSMEIVEKAREDANDWNQAQLKRKTQKDNNRIQRYARWTKPREGTFKCNLGFSFDKNKLLAGSSWVLRNHRGQVLLHSRRAYSQIYGYQDAKIKCWIWAMESMESLGIKNVTFASTTNDIISALNDPHNWPAFKGVLAEPLTRIKRNTSWELIMESKNGNEGATLIAESVTRDDRLQSYVAKGPPSWLQDLFNREMNETYHQEQEMINPENLTEIRSRRPRPDEHRPNHHQSWRTERQQRYPTSPIPQYI